MDEEKIIEVEVESTSLDEPERKEAVHSERVRSDYSRKIYFFGRTSRILLRFSIPLFFISLGLGLTFSILYSENTADQIRLVTMIIFWSLAGLCLFAMLLANLFRYVMRSYKKKDPNFEESVHDDYVYEK